MKENKKQVLKTLTEKHIEMINAGKLNTIKGGIVVCEPIAS